MELANIINVLYELLINKPMKVSSYALDDQYDRVKLFHVMLNEFMVEMNKE